MTLASGLRRAAQRLRGQLPAAPLAAAWPVWAGLAMLAAAAALALGSTPRWQARTAARLAELQRPSQASGAERGHETPLAPAQPAAPLLPDSAASPRRARALGALASRLGLSVLQTREQLDTAGHLLLTQSGQATYPALRGFVERALAADPALALDRLRLQRSDPVGAEVGFELQWTLLHRAAPAPPAAMPAAVAARPSP